MKYFTPVLLLSLLTMSSPSYSQPLASLDSWEQKDFVERNQFEFPNTEIVSSVKTVSEKSSSGLFLKQDINLNETPILSWSWKTNNVFRSLNETSKKGDDFAARVYIVASTGPFPWQKKTICYVWSNYQKIDTQWKNPFADSVVMIAVDSGNKEVGTWRTHHRDVQADLKQIFNETFDSIEVIALMTDTDNSGQKSTTWYKDFQINRR